MDNLIHAIIEKASVEIIVLVLTIMMLLAFILKLMKLNVELTKAVMDMSDKSISLGKDTVKSLGHIEQVMAVIKEKISHA